MSSRFVRVGCALLMLGAVASCGGGTATTSNLATGTQIQALASIQFSPSSVSISPGDKVSFVFGSVGHNVTFDAVAGAPANLDGANSNTTISRTFNTVGVYPFHCNIHPSMTGSVQVGAVSVEPPPPPPPPPPPGYSRKTGG